MKHIFKKLHKSQNDANRSNETLTPASGASTNQSQQPGSSDHADSAAVASQAPATSMEAPATEAVVVPASHASGGGGWGTNRGGDFFSSEEEFQMQLALAISASNSEVQDDPENDQIRAATLLSLGRSNCMDRRGDVEVSGEALSRRYWDYNVLDYKEKVIDGFYDVYAIDMDPTSPGKIPSLVDLETSPGDSGYEAVIVNRTIDAMLLELEQVAHCIAIDCPPSNVNVFVQRLAELVTDHMGGPVKDANTMLARWMERSAELRTSLHTSVFPIGSLKLGMTRHRALLFKVIADNVGLSCKLMKGCHYTGVEDVAVNMIKLDDEREYLVDLMADPGTLIPADVLSAKDSSSQSTNQVLKKLPYMQLTNDSEAAYPRPKQTKCINPATSMGTAEKPMQLDRMMGIEMAKAPPSSATKLTSSNQIDFPSTSAVGASLHKANRGALTAGDGSRMNVNVVPYNQNNVDEAKNLFADLNPFQIRGSGRLVQNKSQEDKFVESQRQRTDPVSGRPPLPMMWKHNQAMNQVPKKKNQDFVHSLLPRNNHDASDCNKSSSASSCSPSEIIYPNTSKGTIETYVPCHYKNVGNSENISSIAAPDRMGSNSLSLTDSRKIIHDGRSQGSEGTLSPEISDVEKGHKIGVNGVQDHCSTHDSFMKTNMLPHDKGSCNCAIDPSASSANPVLDDVGECEIPWEDLDIGKRIGIGSYGEVYHADWNGTEVAVKKFLDQDFSGAALAEFKREVRIMRKLWHPNIVLFMGAVTRPPHLSIISEYLPRGSLYRIIHRPNCQIDERRRLKMALDVARGMNCLHTSVPTIVHRDLKSPNLLVDKNWTVKVCDFGLSRLKHNTFLSSKSAAGTPEWMAPEVLRNEPLNEKCDVYSFGVILWELATLKLPWSKMNPMQVVGAVGFRNQRLEIPKEVDPLVARIIQECWQTDPSLRPSFAELCVALKPLQHLNIHSSSADQQSSPMPQQISVNSKPMF